MLVYVPTGSWVLVRLQDPEPAESVTVQSVPADDVMVTVPDGVPEVAVT